MNTLALITAIALGGSGLIGILINFIILCLILAIIYWIVTIIPWPAPIAQFVMIAFYIIAAIVLIYFLLGLTGTL